MHYKLAVFGDSYADNKGPFNDGWHQCVCELQGWDLEETINFGESGAGNWWAYINFIKFINEGNTAEHYVFSLTSLNRFPLEKGRNYGWVYPMYSFPSCSDFDVEMWKSGLEDHEAKLDDNGGTIRKLFDYWDAVHPTKEADGCSTLVHFINNMVWKELNHIVTRDNLNVVFIIPFGFGFDEYCSLYKSQKPMITNIDEVSRLEMSINEPGWAGMSWSIHNGNGSNNDARTNHLCKHNNILLAEIIAGCMEHQNEITHYFDETEGLIYGDEALNGYGTVIWEQV